MKKALKIIHLGSLCLLLLGGYAPKAVAQVLKNWEQTTINVPLPDGDYKMIYIRANNPEGLQNLTAKIPTTGDNYPLVLLKEADVQPLLAVMRLYKLEAAEEDTYTQRLSELTSIYEEKQKTWRSVDSIQLIRITYLKQHNQDLMDINDTLAKQVKASLTTAKEANKGRGWQGFKDIVLGGAAGLAIGVLLGALIK